MAFLGWCVLLSLTLLAAIASLGVAVRCRPEGRAEAGVIALLLLFALIGAPILLLGYTGTLTARNLAGTAALLAVATLAATGRGDHRAHLRECIRSAKSLASLPWTALREAFDAGSLATVGILFTGWLLLQAFAVTWLVPSASWDGYFYHEPIIGFALQNHGFSMVELPQNYCAQAINGYPKFVECLSLWFVIFTDKTLIELPTLLAAPPLMLAAYVMLRRWSDRVTATGFAIVLFLVPHVWHLLCSTYIDMEVAFFLLAAMHFSSRPDYRIRDALLATLAMGLVVLSKGSWLVWIPPFALVAYGRLLARYARTRGLATGGTILLGGLSLAALGAITLLRNWHAFHNAVWPITFDLRHPHLHWDGLVDVDKVTEQPPWPEFIGETYAPPTGGMGDIRHRGFGMAVPYVVLPIAFIAFAAAAFRALFELGSRRAEKPTLGLWALAFPGLIAFKTSPSLEQPRYNVHLIIALLCGCVWLMGSERWRRAREAVLGACLVLSMMPFVWLGDAVLVGGEELFEHLRHPLAMRTYGTHSPLDAIAEAREREIHKGDKVAFTEGFLFIGAAWNFEMSNEVKYFPFSSERAFARQMDAYGAKWVIVDEGGPARRSLEKAGTWEFVGKVTGPAPEVAFRRKPPSQGGSG